MTRTLPPVVTCPSCGSSGATLHHDIRCSLRYFCERCGHEWQIDAADEPPNLDPVLERRPRAPARTIFS